MSRLPIQINTNAIPKPELNALCHTFLEAIKRFYANPANMEEYKKWKEERDKEAKTCQ